MANAIEERIDTYAVAREMSGDYTETAFTCPTNGRHYLSVRDPIARPRSVVAYCFWCDTHARVRGESVAFKASEPQPHEYPIEVRR